MQAPSNGTKDVRWPATRIKGRQLVLASSIWLSTIFSVAVAMPLNIYGAIWLSLHMESRGQKVISE